MSEQAFTHVHCGTLPLALRWLGERIPLGCSVWLPEPDRHAASVWFMLRRHVLADTPGTADAAVVRAYPAGGLPTPWLVMLGACELRVGLPGPSQHAYTSLPLDPAFWSHAPARQAAAQTLLDPDLMDTVGVMITAVAQLGWLAARAGPDLSQLSKCPVCYDTTVDVSWCNACGNAVCMPCLEHLNFAACPLCRATRAFDGTKPANAVAPESADETLVGALVLLVELALALNGVPAADPVVTALAGAVEGPGVRLVHAGHVLVARQRVERVVPTTLTVALAAE